MEPPIHETPPALDLRDPAPLWGWLRGGLMAHAVLSLLAAGVAAYELSLGVVDFAAMGPEVMIYGLAALVIGVAYIAVFLFCVVSTCRITYRMMRNMHQLNAPEVKMSPGWAVGWYFIPIANLFRPVQGVVEMWRGTQQALGEYGKDNAALPWWWATWVIGNILTNISFRLSIESGGVSEYGPHDLGMYRTALQLDVASNLLGLLSAIFMIYTFAPLVRGQTNLLRVQALS